MPIASCPLLACVDGTALLCAGGPPAPRWATGAAAVGPGGGRPKRLYKAPTDYAKPQKEYTKPRQTIKRPDRLYKTPTDYTKPQKDYTKQENYTKT